MQAETVLDLKYNIAAMYIAILRDDIVTPEQAFAVIDDLPITKVYNDEDALDMISLNEKGYSFSEIGEMYGISKDAVFGRVKRKRDQFGWQSKKVNK